ncbi:MAG: DUF5106 domain-containing protein [Bacteroidaceae bacterium]|nr:DUF5106 domain-containing protein [Bacteroidaceae bacterium]
MMRKGCTLLIWLLCCISAVKAQEAVFPYPEIPDSVEEPSVRLSYILDHFWCHYSFADTTVTNRQVGEQGLVDFLNLMQHADSISAAHGAACFADSLSKYPVATDFFTQQMEHYLADPDSPLHSDEVYALLLRALPQTPQREWLLQQLAKNRTGMVATDIWVTDLHGKRQRLHSIEAELTLLIFFSPECPRCQQLEAQLEQEPLIVQNPRLSVVRMQKEKLKAEYYVPFTPALYLLDKKKRIVLKDTNLQVLLNLLQERKL